MATRGSLAFSWDPTLESLTCPPAPVRIVNEQAPNRAVLWDHTSGAPTLLNTVEQWQYDSTSTRLKVVKNGHGYEINGEALAQIFQRAIEEASLPPDGKALTRFLSYTFKILENEPHLSITLEFKREALELITTEKSAEALRNPPPFGAAWSGRRAPPASLFDPDHPHTSAAPKKAAFTPLLVRLGDSPKEEQVFVKKPIETLV